MRAVCRLRSSDDCGGTNCKAALPPSGALFFLPSSPSGRYRWRCSPGLPSRRGRRVLFSWIFRALLQLVVAPSVSCTVFGSITNWFAVHCAVSCLVRVCDLVLLITWRVRNTSGCIDHVSVPSRRTSCQKTGSSRTRSSIRCKWFFKRYFSSSLPVHRPPPCLVTNFSRTSGVGLKLCVDSSFYSCICRCSHQKPSLLFHSRLQSPLTC